MWDQLSVVYMIVYGKETRDRAVWRYRSGATFDFRGPRDEKKMEYFETFTDWSNLIKRLFRPEDDSRCWREKTFFPFPGFELASFSTSSISTLRPLSESHENKIHVNVMKRWENNFFAELTHYDKYS